MLDILNNEILACSKCEDLVYSRKSPVSGCGNLNAEIFFIGESPGGEEDKQGIPFVGKCGRFFNNVIASFDIKRDDIYISNTCKCRTPQNRTPTVEEIANCSSFLDRELEIINPKYIVCLGAIAAQRIIKTDKIISKLRGKIYIVNKRKVFAFFHPSYIIRNPTFKKDMYDDMKLLIDEIARDKNKLSA